MKATVINMSEENEKKPPAEGAQKPRSHNRHRYGRHRGGQGQPKQPQQPKEALDSSLPKEQKPVEAAPVKAPQKDKNQQNQQNQQNQPQRQKHPRKDAPKKPTDNEVVKKAEQSSEDRSPKQPRDRDRSRNRPQRGVRDGGKQPELHLSSTLLDTDPENDAIFGKLSAQPASKVRTPTFTAEELDQVRKFTDEELFGTDHLYRPINSDSDGAVEVISIRFKKTGKSYYFSPKDHKFSAGDFAILDTARGPEFGEVAEGNKKVAAKNIIQPLRQVIRPATKEDIEKHNSNKRKEAEAFGICLQKIEAHKLDMKLVEAQYAFDGSKLLFYFTSAGRVDFRELVRDLASVFKTRIELRQIGIRDEAKMLGGIGICGRPLCCSRFLSNFAQVSIKMAKEQGLSLNSGKISGNCGRLMCCLNFENQTYLDEIKRTPMPGSVVKFDGQTATVTEATPLIGMLKIHLHSAPDGETVTVHRDSVTVIVKKGEETGDSTPEEE